MIAMNDLDQEAAAIADAIAEHVDGVVDGPKVRDRFVALEQRIAHLEARPLQKWAGVHSTGLPYAEASLVTKAGSLWVSVQATTTTPGTPGSDWRLIVKRGSSV